jgi:hypothetical protein
MTLWGQKATHARGNSAPALPSIVLLNLGAFADGAFR